MHIFFTATENYRRFHYSIFPQNAEVTALEFGGFKIINYSVLQSYNVKINRNNKYDNLF